jgi:FlaG/FlaF family flagellin (archaellin)
MISNRRRCRRGLSTVVVTLILIIVGVTLAVAVYGITSGLMSSSSSTVNMSYAQSNIQVNAATGQGTVYINLVNHGPGGTRILAINVTDKAGNRYSVTFSASGVTDSNSTSTAKSSSTSWSGSAGVGITKTGNTYYLVMPAGGTATLILTFNGTSGSNIANDFDAGATYSGYIIPVSGSDIQFSITAQGLA